MGGALYLIAVGARIRQQALHKLHALHDGLSSVPQRPGQRRIARGELLLPSLTRQPVYCVAARPRGEAFSPTEGARKIAVPT